MQYEKNGESKAGKEEGREEEEEEKEGKEEKEEDEDDEEEKLIRRQITASGRREGRASGGENGENAAFFSNRNGLVNVTSTITYIWFASKEKIPIVLPGG